MKLNDLDYTARLQAEIEHFRNVENVHELPAIYSVWANNYVQPKVNDPVIHSPEKGAHGP